jgi:NAD(P)-dependent dehydrogenase (short-subunit alcohol dehydrogenase family)
MNELFKLDGKVAVVTGGAGQLGTQYCNALAGYGAKVAIFDVKDEADLTGTFDPHIMRYFQVDITKKASIEAALTRVIQLWGAPDILINNAAIDSPPNSAGQLNVPFEEFSEDIYEKVMAVNVKGTVFCCQAIGKVMADKKGGSIINICSTYGILSPNHKIYEYKNKDGKGWYKPVVYSISKSALLNLTRYLATYWANKGVRVNTVTPGGIFNHQDEQFLAEYTKRVPMERMAFPHELNGAIVFLSSDASSYVTGANIIVDGGWSAW